jgi:hypothetical protein
MPENIDAKEQAITSEIAMETARKIKEVQSTPSYERLKESYQENIKEYNALVKNHNTLVDRYGELLDDARSLIAMLDDIRKGLYVYISGGIVLGPIPLTKLEQTSELQLDEGRAFCIGFYNEIIELIQELKSGKHAKQVYLDWMTRCADIYKNVKGDN